MAINKSARMPSAIEIKAKSRTQISEAPKQGKFDRIEDALDVAFSQDTSDISSTESPQDNPVEMTAPGLNDSSLQPSGPYSFSSGGDTAQFNGDVTLGQEPFAQYTVAAGGHVVVLRVLRTEFGSRPEIHASIPLDLIEPGDHNARTVYDEDLKNQRKAEMERQGQITPVEVYWSPERQKFVLLDGVTRFKSAQELTWTHLEARVIESQLCANWIDRLAYSKEKNDGPTNSSDFDEACHYKAAMDRGYSSKEIAESLKVPEQRVRNLSRLAAFQQHTLDVLQRYGRHFKRHDLEQLMIVYRVSDSTAASIAENCAIRRRNGEKFTTTKLEKLCKEHLYLLSPESKPSPRVLTTNTSFTDKSGKTLFKLQMKIDKSGSKSIVVRDLMPDDDSLAIKIQDLIESEARSRGAEPSSDEQ